MVAVKKIIVSGIFVVLAGVSLSACAHSIRIKNESVKSHRWQIQNVNCNKHLHRPGFEKPMDCDSGTLGAQHYLAWGVSNAPLPLYSCAYQVLIDGKMYCKGMCLDEAQPVIIHNGKFSGFDVRCPKLER